MENYNDDFSAIFCRELYIELTRQCIVLKGMFMLAIRGSSIIRFVDSSIPAGEREEVD